MELPAMSVALAEIRAHVLGLYHNARANDYRYASEYASVQYHPGHQLLSAVERRTKRIEKYERWLAAIDQAHPPAT